MKDGVHMGFILKTTRRFRYTSILMKSLSFFKDYDEKVLKVSSVYLPNQMRNSRSTLSAESEAWIRFLSKRCSFIDSSMVSRPN